MQTLCDQLVFLDGLHRGYMGRGNRIPLEIFGTIFSLSSMEKVRMWSITGLFVECLASNLDSELTFTCVQLPHNMWCGNSPRIHYLVNPSFISTTPSKFGRHPLIACASACESKRTLARVSRTFMTILPLGVSHVRLRRCLTLAATAYRLPHGRNTPEARVDWSGESEPGPARIRTWPRGNGPP